MSRPSSWFERTPPSPAQLRRELRAAGLAVLSICAIAVIEFIPTKPKQADMAPAPSFRRGAFSAPTVTTRIGAAVGEGLGKARDTAGGVAWQPCEISVYHPRYHGRTTANGETYDHRLRWTAAVSVRQLDLAPLGSVWRVRYRGRTIEVRVNDTGSYAAPRGRLWLDLSGRSWSELTRSKPSRFRADARRIR